VYTFGEKLEMCDKRNILNLVTLFKTYNVLRKTAFQAIIIALMVK